MQAFAELFTAIDETTRTSEKVAAMAAYFRQADPRDAAWALYFLTGRKPKQVVPTKFLRRWAAEQSGLPDWLFEECYHAVGDLAETIALVVPPPTRDDPRPLHQWVEETLLPLRGEAESVQKATLLRAWDALPQQPRFLWNKMITGQLRVGVSQLLVVRALAEASQLPAETIAHRLMGDWQPTPAFYAGLVSPSDSASERSRPYPFFLATPIEGTVAELGDLADWAAEWKWDGIRGQLIQRDGEVFLWSRGEELITDRYPEISIAATALPDGTVLDGEILPWGTSGVRPFAELQRRIGRKTLTKKILDEVPVVFLAYDLLELAGKDCRAEPWQWRREQLEALLTSLNEVRLALAETTLFDEPSTHQERVLRLSPLVEADSWASLAEIREDSRGRQVEGIMLKRRSSPYRVGRVRGDWWKWKVNPLSVDAVLVAARRGSGKRASLYTDYTFALWHGGQLVNFAQAYSGLTDEEIREVDAFIRANTLDRFGPVRTVKPELVFEIGFEGIQRSTRHKSGIAVRFPRILRQRPDKPATEADTLEAVMKLLAG